MCEYEIIYYRENHSSLYEIIRPARACLDWTEICDGHIDYLDGDFEEEHCWKLEMNECEDDEYRCTNGQCIPQSFVRNDSNTPDCVDGSDEFRITSTASTNCEKHIPSFQCEDRIRQYTFLTNSCVQERKNLLWEAFYSVRDGSISEQYWSAFKCIINVFNS
ncbi:unnamed protein product [Rotaria magnacalcarata]|uniref:Vitellogenin receptor n=1 Tax=Rotaria magnacalcarata TaxID=392030 RepID=A0A819QWW2_9BILA|nr:unnamed protein product [Rotaria magnacalcarata]